MELIFFVHQILMIQNLIREWGSVEVYQIEILNATLFIYLQFYLPDASQILFS